MSLSVETAPSFRELGADEHTAFYEHLLRLGAASRYMRFGHAVGEEFLKSYCQSIGRLNIVTYGAFVDGDLRAVAELRRVSDLCPTDGEIGLTVEDDWQDAGIGTELLAHVQATARHRGIETIHMICSRKNYRMRSVAQKVRAQVKPLANQIVGQIGGQIGGFDADAAQNGAETPLNHFYQDTDFVTFSLEV